MKLIIASRNKHKVTEIQAILSSVPNLEIVSLDGYVVPEIIEDQDTFIGNATKKAVETAIAVAGNTLPFGLTPPPAEPPGKIFPATALAVLADDSGLSVDALDGAPGVHSAYYAGQGATSQQLCEKLLRELKGVPPENRTARFTTVLVIAAPSVSGGAVKILYTAEGVCEGLITEEMRGNSGFGYDPVFYYPSAKKTFAEMTAEEKNLRSHRYLALQDLLGKIKLQCDYS